MIAKLFEIRDRRTFIPILAVKIAPANEAEAFLLCRSGFTGNDPGVVLLGRIDGSGGPLKDDPSSWGTRTMEQAHAYISKCFDSLEPGEVVDVEFILDETDKPKVSERFEI